MEDITSDLRDPKLIASQVKLVRIGKAHMDDWSIEEIIDDIRSLSQAISKDTEKFKTKGHGYIEAGKRARKYLSAMETLGIKFRVLSV